jgi:ABC-type nitrate/sulfonate/bicarbonate transport system ATPase subunit
MISGATVLFRYLRQMSITRVIVAHRAETIRMADRVVHLDSTNGDAAIAYTHFEVQQEDAQRTVSAAPLSVNFSTGKTERRFWKMPR